MSKLTRFTFWMIYVIVQILVAVQYEIVVLLFLTGFFLAGVIYTHLEHERIDEEIMQEYTLTRRIDEKPKRHG